MSRKHFRVETSDHRFVKLNEFENRLNARELSFYCWKLTPLHVYFSVLNWRARILLMSLDKEDNGSWKAIPKEQVEKLEKGLKVDY